MILPISLIFGVLGGYFGWAGSRGDDFWFQYRFGFRWMYDTVNKDLGVGLMTVIPAFIFGVHSWLLFISLGLMYGAISTYRYFLPKPKEYGFLYFALHGFMIGLAASPIAFVTGHWVLLFVRCIILAVFIGGWSKFWGNCHVEDSGKYFSVPATIFIIC